MEQETLLQIHCKELGAMSDRISVVHCKIDGECIKFNWGYLKINYRAKPNVAKNVPSACLPRAEKRCPTL